MAVALLAIGTSLSAQGPGPGHGHGPAQEGHGFKGLNLTEAQQAQVKAIHDKHQATMKAKMDAADAAQKAMHAAMADVTSDTNTLKALHEKASAAQFDLMIEHRAIRQEILPLLTAEQKVQFQKHPMGMGPHGDRGMNHGAGHGHGPHHGMGPDGPAVKPS
jgi:Spy/CpxP family protein refolding chaperone